MSWTLVLLALAVISGCSDYHPPYVPPPPSGAPPEIRSLGAPSQLLCGEMAVIMVEVWPGQYELAELAVDFEGDGQIDTVKAIGPSPLVHSFNHRYEQAGVMHLTAIVRDVEGRADTATVTLTAQAFRFGILLDPVIGTAPLTTHLRIRHEFPAEFQQIRIDWQSDGVVDTAYTPQGAESQHTFRFDPGEFPVEVVAYVQDTTVIRRDTVFAQNTPPEGSLPVLNVPAGEQLPVVVLWHHFSDLQTPARELLYEIENQSGPVTAHIDSVVLVFDPSDSTAGGGVVNVRVSDPHGGSVVAPLQYTLAVIPGMVHLQLRLADLETEAPVVNGLLSVESGTYLVTPAAPVVHAYVTSATYYRVFTYRLEDAQVTSYERTLLFPAERDTSAAIPLITFDRVLQTGLSTMQFHDFNEQARQLQISDVTHSTGLGSIRFANAAAGWADGGYTIYIERQNPAEPADSLTVAEQLYIEQVLETELLRDLPSISQRPVLYRAQAEDPVYLAADGPEHSGLLLVFKGESPGVASFDDAADGAIDRAVITLPRDFDQVHVLHSVLRALAAPAAYATLPLAPEQTILHPQTTATELTAADRLLLTIAAKTRPGIYLDDLFRTPS